ncbi:MAG: FAD-dependent oxidoreductase, partial [Proteobacteria bacterium]|nr:FAD-dependent oxidoreductase [Pseudomonadota bacterium]
NIHGYHKSAHKFEDLALYGSDAPAIMDLMRATPEYKELIHPELSARVGEIIWAARLECARTVEDFLARRSRSLLLNARASAEAAPKVAEVMAKELGRSTEWENEQIASFQALTRIYLPD